MADRKKDEATDEKHVPPTREDLNDTGEGMPLAMASGGYGGSEKTVEKNRDKASQERNGDDASG